VPINLPLDKGYTLALRLPSLGDFTLLATPWRVEIIGKTMLVEGVNVGSADMNGLIVIEMRRNENDEVECTFHTGHFTKVPWQETKDTIELIHRALCGKGEVEFLWFSKPGTLKQLTELVLEEKEEVGPKDGGATWRPFRVYGPLIGDITHPSHTPFFVSDAFKDMNPMSPESIIECFQKATSAAVVQDFPEMGRRLGELSPSAIYPEIIKALPNLRDAFYHIFTHQVWREASVEVRHARALHFYASEVPLEEIFIELLAEKDEGCLRWLISAMLDNQNCTDEFLNLVVSEIFLRGESTLQRLFLKALRLRNPRKITIEQFLHHHEPRIQVEAVMCLRHFGISPSVELLNPIRAAKFEKADADTLADFIILWLSPRVALREELSTELVVALLTTFLHVLEYVSDATIMLVKVREWFECSTFGATILNEGCPPRLLEALLTAIENIPNEEGLILLYTSLISEPLCDHHGYQGFEFSISFLEENWPERRGIGATALEAVFSALATRYNTRFSMGAGLVDLVPLTFVFEEFLIAPYVLKDEDFMWPVSGSNDAPLVLTDGSQEVLDSLLLLWDGTLKDPLGGQHPSDVDIYTIRSNMKEQCQVLLTADERTPSNGALVTRLVHLCRHGCAFKNHLPAESRNNYYPIWKPSPESPTFDSVGVPVVEKKKVVQNLLRTIALSLLTLPNGSRAITGIVRNASLGAISVLYALFSIQSGPEEEETLSIIGEIVLVLKLLQRERACSEPDCQQHLCCDLLRKLGQEKRLQHLPLLSFISWPSFGMSPKQNTPRDFKESIDNFEGISELLKIKTDSLSSDAVDEHKRIRADKRKMLLESKQEEEDSFPPPTPDDALMKRSAKARRRARKLEAVRPRKYTKWKVDQMEDSCGRRTLLTNFSEGGSSSSSSGGEEEDETFPCFLVRREGRIPASLTIYDKSIKLRTETKTRKWHFEDLRAIFPKRYLLRPAALELHFESAWAPILLHFEGPPPTPKAESAFTSFEEMFRNSWLGRPFGAHALSRRDKVWEKLETALQKGRTKGDKPKHTDGATLRQVHDEMTAKNLKVYTEQWRNGEISNFFYLNALNFLSGRSLEDLSQYPVFPWVVEGTNGQMKLRDLTNSMGELGTKHRKEQFAQRYEELWQEQQKYGKKEGEQASSLVVPPYHFGSHYSSPAIVMNFLVRLEPFAEEAKKLQGGKFDLPDRIFASYLEAWKSATSVMSDVRELLPEFYSLPEAFLNWNDFDFGTRQDGNRVLGEVEFPDWAPSRDAQPTYSMIHLLRTHLESPQVTRCLNAWIDLIWGHKQTGKEAVKALNVFFHLTYEGNVKEETVTSTEMQQLLGFGQTPKRMFTEPHVESLLATFPSFFNGFTIPPSGRLVSAHPSRGINSNTHAGFCPQAVVYACSSFLVTLEQAAAAHAFLPTLGCYDAETKILATGGYSDGSFVVAGIGKKDAGAVVTSISVLRRLLCIGLNNGVVRFVMRARAYLKHLRSYPAVERTTGAVLSIAFDDAKPMVAVAQSRYIRLFRTMRQTAHIRDLEAPSDVLQVCFASRAPASVVGLMEGEVAVWSINGPLLATLKIFATCILSISERDKREGVFVAERDSISFFGLPFLETVSSPVPVDGVPVALHLSSARKVYVSQLIGGSSGLTVSLLDPLESVISF